jgi:hypothetical protein
LPRGHLQLSAQGATSTTSISPVVSIDQNGVATANQPGSVLISANVSGAASSAGVFSTCPPASITLSTPGTTSDPVVVNENNPQAMVASVLDTNNHPINGLSLEYVTDLTDHDSRRHHWDGNATLRWCSLDLRGMPAAKLQSCVVQPDRSVRQWPAGYFKSGEYHHSRH